MEQPVLVFAYGNPSRGDDGLGPKLVENLQQHSSSKFPQVEFLIDFQLQIEHALDLQQRQLVLFVDAAVTGPDPFQLTQVQAQYDTSYTTHAMSPAAVLQVYQLINKDIPPPSFLLSIKARQFDLGESLSCEARNNLVKAEIFAEKLLSNPTSAAWLKIFSNARNIAA